MKKVLVLTALALAVAPAVALAANPGGAKQSALVAPRLCHTLQSRLGAQSFRQTFGTLGGCVSRLAQADQLNNETAEALCRTEQNDANFASTHNGQSFVQFYGRGQNAANNAFGNCVSAKASASATAVQQATPNPSRTCRAMRTAMTSATFSLAFGTNANHRNAYGKCVSLVARTGVTNVVAAAQSCSAEAADANFASTHDNKTFAQFYGTNSDLSNAFGNCVAQKALAAAALQQKALVNAAKACKAERAASATTFRSNYGSGANAFAKCVTKKTHAK